ILPRTPPPPDPPLPSTAAASPLTFAPAAATLSIRTAAGHIPKARTQPSRATHPAQPSSSGVRCCGGEGLTAVGADKASGSGEHKLDESSSDGRDLGGSVSGGRGYGGSSGRGRQIRRAVPLRSRWARPPDPAGIWPVPPASTGPRLSTPKGRASSCRGRGHNTSAFPPLPVPKFTASRARAAPPTAARPITAVSMPTVVTAAAAIPR
ncbi:unnamed protein product, partial [Urochloa humidicola]